jgi:CheY-specific phosphatase CheX
MTNHATHTSTSPYAEQLQAELPRVMKEVMLGLLGESVQDSTHPANDSFLRCRVSIRGSFHGEVIVSATLALASHIAEQMFDDELEGRPNCQDARDALREVSNIVAGNLKSLFGENNQLGLPEDLTADHDLLASQLATCTLERPPGVLEVVIYTSL